MTPATNIRTTATATVAVSEVMHPGFVSCSFETPLTTVARLMAEHRVHCIVGFGDVTEDDTSVWGVVSDIDVVSALALAAGDQPLTAGEIAATEVVTVKPFDSILDTARLMRDHGVSHVLVADPHSDRPLGVLSTLDIAAFLGGVELGK
ncbi:MAG: CBS domain-containing protein [Candidatus Limnocylindria bacterium]